MSTSEPAEKALAKFKSLRPELFRAASDVLNESDTRFKIIDRLLTEVMGWLHDQVSTEPLSTAGYLDDLLSVTGKRGSLVSRRKRSES